MPGAPLSQPGPRIEEENEVFYANPRTTVPREVPVAVLINEGSASASEIMAGALKDTDRAILIGNTSFGTGSVQQVRAFGNGGFKITTSRYYTPIGINIDKVGIDPHMFVELEEFSETDLEALQQLYDENLVALYVEEHPMVSEDATKDFIGKIEEKGINLEEKVLRKLLREEYNRNLNTPPVFDLEYDTVLIETARLLKKGLSVEEMIREAERAE